MISPPTSPTFTPSRSISGKPHTENDNQALSPKRSFAQLDEDQPSQPGLKRRDLQPSKRAPLDPLSTSNLENRRARGSQLADSASYHTLLTPSSVLDVQVLHPERSVSSGFCGMGRGGISDALVCSWPPPTPTPGSGRSSPSSFAGQQAPQCSPLHSPDAKTLSHATFPETTSTAWGNPDTFQSEPTATMTKPTRMSGWKAENVLQPIRSRSTSMPSVRRPPGELWRPEPGPTKIDHRLVDTAVPSMYPAPPGSPSRRSELRRSDSHSGLLSHRSVSLSLAYNSQPLKASDHTKAVPPIGAERSWAASITSLKSHLRKFPATESHDPAKSPWSFSSLSPKLRAKWKNEMGLLSATSSENVEAAPENVGMSKEDLERLLRHADRNKHAPRIISPLSPLRTTTSALGLSTDPTFQSRTPSHLNSPSPRYSRCLPRRARMICDGYQTFDWNTTCMHCHECKRDTLRKRLLAFRYRQLEQQQQQQTHHWHVQRSRVVAHPHPLHAAATMPVVDDDRIVLANRIRKVFAYEMDEEEKSLWEEVAAVTGAGPFSISRVGMPCGVAAHQRVLDDGSDDGAHDDYQETADGGLLANESATLFRDVSVY